MFIKYKLADGHEALVEVTEEVAAYLAEEERLTGNADRKERYHAEFSLDAVEYEGTETAYHHSPETVYIRREETRHIRDVASLLTDAQLRRLLMRAEGMTFREIAAAEGISPNAVVDTLKAVKKVFEKNY